MTVVRLRTRRGRPRFPGPRPSRHHRSRLARAYLSRSLRPTLSSLAHGWVFFLPGIALPGLGTAAEPWAIVTRVCGGYATVQQTILAPPMESRMARAVRERDPAAFGAARRTALLVGSGISVLAMTTGLGLALYEGWDSAGEWLAPVTAATLLFWGVLMAGGLIHRVPNFVGRDTPRLVWDSTRAALVTLAFIATDGISKLIVIGVILTVYGQLLVPMSRYRSAAGG